MTTWTDDRVDRLKKLYADGMSFTKIAADLGGISRNGVIGKVHRLDLQKRGKPAPLPKKKRDRPGPIASLVTPGRFGPPPPLPAAALAPEPETPPEVLPIGQRCSILELGEGKCRWPIGDPGTPDFFFCGGKTIEALPYCGYHSRIAYVPAR